MHVQLDHQTPGGRRSCNPPNRASCVTKASQCAFTLIEVLVVIVIIGILSGLVIGLASRVTSGGKFAASKNLIQSLDTILTEYGTLKETQIPAWVRTNQTQMSTDGTNDQLFPDEYIFPLFDGRFATRMLPPPSGGGTGTSRFDRELDPQQPVCALFLLLAAAESPEVDRAIKRLDAKFIQRQDVWAHGWKIDAASGLPTGLVERRRLRIPVPVDAYGFQIRMVHPQFQGGFGRYYYPNTAGSGAWQQDGSDTQHPGRVNARIAPDWYASQPPGVSPSAPAVGEFSRSYRPFDPTVISGNVVGDADEGSCTGSRAYFYSAGSDGDPGTRSDNVYTVDPIFPRENSGAN